VVPFTSGGLLERTHNPKNTRDWSKVGLEDRFAYLDFSSTIYDIFRKIDLTNNRALDEYELDKFGTIVDL